MNAALSPSTQRILVAISASMLIHAALITLSDFELPAVEPDLPPLAAQLIMLPQAPKPTKHPSPMPARPPRTDTIPRISNDPDATDVAASSVAATPEEPASAQLTMVSDPIAASVLAPPAASAAAAAGSAPFRPQLPKRAHLKFQVRIGKNGMAVGEARHVLEIDNGRYELTATTRTIGLARLVKSYQLVQTSSGDTDGISLHPTRYSEDKSDDGKQHSDSVTLDHAAQNLLFSSGRKLPLPESTQDILSILYQFPPLPEAGDVLSIAITNGHDWERYKFEIATDEELITPLGKLHTVHFRKLHPPGKEGLEIWFAQEYRLLPVKLRHIDRDGSIAGEAIITDIRIAEE